jgi:hypothetical protein
MVPASDDAQTNLNKFQSSCVLGRGLRFGFQLSHERKPENFMGHHPRMLA